MHAKRDVEASVDTSAYESILQAATEEIASQGFAGARVDSIAAASNVSKRMLYYYFVDKAGLYRAVLEREFLRLRRAEWEDGLDDRDPEAAMRLLIKRTFTYLQDNPNMVRISMGENILRGDHLRQIPSRSDMIVPTWEGLERLLQRGYDSGVFRREVDARVLHFLIYAVAFFRISNRYTVELLYDAQPVEGEFGDVAIQTYTDMVLQYLLNHPEGS